MQQRVRRSDQPSGRMLAQPWGPHDDFFLIFAGTFDIIISISARREIEVWWLQLVGGILELALGFWAAGYYGRSAVLLIAWVAAFALIRGVRDIVLAFRVREVQHAAPA